MPPWISRLERDEVPQPTVRRSSRVTESPRMTASRATAAPTMPPPRIDVLQTLAFESLPADAMTCD